MTGAELRAAMERLCHRPATLARLLGVARQTVHKWLAGQDPVPAPQAAYVRRLAAWLDRNPPPPSPPGAIRRRE